MDRQQNLGFLLKEVSRRYVARFEAHARSIALTLMQCKVLVHLERCEGASQARLAEITELEPMTMVRLLNCMEADKLIERRSDPSDRRARKLYLTPKARPLLEEIWRLAAVARGEMFGEVPKADRDVFARVLEQAHANLCALEREAGQGREGIGLSRACARRVRTGGGKGDAVFGRGAGRTGMRAPRNLSWGFRGAWPRRAPKPASRAWFR